MTAGGPPFPDRLDGGATDARGGGRPAPREVLEVDKLADLAQGGMGSVELGVARSGRLAGRVLAIKRLHPDLARDPDIVSMFVDEAWLTSQIRSPHVVRVEAFAEDARGLFLACELVQGVSLGRLMAEARARGEAFTERTVAFIASQVCAGLAAAHDLRDPEGRPLGLVHRDLTPGNVLVGFDGVVKIADFGIAKAERRVTAATQMGVLKGKPSYVAPEQVRGGPIDGRADLFALGIVLFELLAGRRPWRGKDDTDVLIAMMRTDPPRLTELRPDVTPAMARLVECCLRKPVAERPRSADEVRAQLDALREAAGFVRDDAAWLVDFVRRNGAELAAWFDGALAGHLASGGPSLQQAEEEIDHTRVHLAAPAEPRPPAGPAAAPRTPASTALLADAGGEAATTFYQHADPMPGAAAMAAALAERPRLPAPPPLAPSGAAELSRMPASTPQRFSAQTEILPPSGTGAAPGSARASSAPRTPPAATEWLPGPPAPQRQPPSGGPPASAPAGPAGAYSLGDAGVALPPPGPQGVVPPGVVPPGVVRPGSPRPAPAGRGASTAVRVVIVFAVVFVVTAVAVGALLRSGLVAAP